MNRRNVLVRSLAALIAAVLALAVPSQAHAQPRDPGAIVGIVVNGDNRPVPGAIVELMHEGRMVAHARSKDDGKFEFPRVRPGHYVVHAGKRDVGRGRERVAVKSGETSRTKITLKK